MKSFDTVEFNRKNLDENDSDYSYDAYDAYSTECIGSSWLSRINKGTNFVVNCIVPSRRNGNC